MIASVGARIRAQHIHFLMADERGDVAQQTLPVVGLNAHVHGIARF